MLGHLDVFEQPRWRSVSCVQENKLFTPPPFTSKSWQTIQPPQIWGGGSEEESLVTRQPQCHLPRHARISHLPPEAARMRYIAAFKSLFSRIHMENKTITETQLNYASPGKKVWCDYIAFSPRVGERKGFVAYKLSRWALLKSPGGESNSATTDVFQRRPVALKYMWCVSFFNKREFKVRGGRSSVQ